MKQQKPVSTSQLITLAQQHIHNWKQIYRGRRGTRVKQDDVSTILFSFMFSLPDLDGSGWAHISAHPCNYFTNLARSTHSSLGRWVRGLKKKNQCSQTQNLVAQLPNLHSYAVFPTPQSLSCVSLINQMCIQCAIGISWNSSKVRPSLNSKKSLHLSHFRLWFGAFALNPY